MILVDTSLIIDFLRKEIKPRVKPLVNILESGEQLALSVVTVAELYSGSSVWEKKSNRLDLEVIIGGMEVILVNHEIAKRGGKIQAETNIGLLDALIAATALSEKLTLATLNPKDFGMVKGLKLYRL